MASVEPSAFGAVETGADYLATETHYLSVTSRIVSALQAGAGFVLVTGDPPPDPHLISQALRRLTEAGYTATPISCESETAIDQLHRAGSMVATLAAGGRIATIPESPEADPPLFLLSELDDLSAPQIEKICDAVRHGPRSGTAAMLLVRPGFLARLDDGALQSVKDLMAVQLSFEEIGKDEGLDFLRHQLTTRHHRKEPGGVPKGAVRALLVFALLVAVVAGGFILLQRLLPGGVSPPMSLAPTAKQESTIPEKPPTEPKSAPAVLSVRPLDPAPQPSPLPSAPPSPSVQRFPPAEIAALMTRGDDFLKAGDIASARLFYERAADAGDGAAALRLGATFDPGLLARAGIRGTPGDPAKASAWYRRARDLGDAAAAERLKGLEQPPSAKPGSSSR
jgi:hypothetical protein